MSAEFLRKLKGLAQLSGRDLGPEAFELYDRLIAEPYGDNRASGALLEWIKTKGRGFPTPAEIITILEPTTIDEKQQADDLAAKLMGAIARKGYVWASCTNYAPRANFEDDFKHHLGELAWAVVTRVGGWKSFCEQFDQGVNHNARPQLRDLVCSVIAHAKAGRLDEKPALPGPQQNRLDAPKSIGEIMKHSFEMEKV